MRLANIRDIGLAVSAYSNVMKALETLQVVISKVAQSQQIEGSMDVQATVRLFAEATQESNKLRQESDSCHVAGDVLKLQQQSSRGTNARTMFEKEYTAQFAGVKAFVEWCAQTYKDTAKFCLELQK